MNLKIKLLFLSELLNKFVDDLMSEKSGGAFTQRAQRTMARAAFKMLSAGIDKMSEADLAKITRVIMFVQSDDVISSLTDEQVLATDYQEKIGRFIEHARAASEDTTEQTVHVHREN